MILSLKCAILNKFPQKLSGHGRIFSRFIPITMIFFRSTGSRYEIYTSAVLRAIIMNILKLLKTTLENKLNVSLLQQTTK